MYHVLRLPPQRAAASKTAQIKWYYFRALASEIIFQDEKFAENDLSKSAEIFISENDMEKLENCTLVYPES